MKKLIWLFTAVLTLTLAACSDDELHGRFIGPEGALSYEFQSDDAVKIVQGENIILAEYHYDSGDELIKLTAEQHLPPETLTVLDDHHLQKGEIILTRGLDYAMLADTTWIGEQGQYTFSLTFTPTEQGMQTFSELVTYDDEDMTYLSQTDESITQLAGNILLLDMTRYIVSDVTAESFQIAIGDKSMTLKKQPKDTPITIKDDFKSIDE